MSKMKGKAREAPAALLEAAALLLDGAGGSLLTTPLVKALFYLDLHSLLETGKVATGTSYVTLKAGPVVENYQEQLITALEQAKLALQESDNPDYKPVVLLHPVKPRFLSTAARKFVTGNLAHRRGLGLGRRHAAPNPDPNRAERRGALRTGANGAGPMRSPP